MIIPNKIILVFFGLFYSFNLSSQTLKGRVYNLKDSLPVSFATIVLGDFSDKQLTANASNFEGQFNIQIPEKAYYLMIASAGFAQLKILNITKEYSDTIDLGQLPLIEIPLIYVSFTGISERKERRLQRKIIKDYNRYIMTRKNQVVEINHRKVTMTVNKTKQLDSERMKILYILDWNEVVEKN